MTQFIMIKPVGMLPLIVLPNYPILSINRINCWQHGDIPYTSPKIVEAKDLITRERRLGDSKRVAYNSHVLIPRYHAVNCFSTLDISGRKKHSGEVYVMSIVLDEELAWIMGLYTAEGSVGRGVKKSGSKTDPLILQFALDKKEISWAERIQKYFSKYAIRSTIKHNGRKESNGIVVVVYSSIFAQNFAKWFGEGSVNKSLPSWMLQNTQDKIATAFLDGWECGDGTIYRNGNIITSKAYTVSKFLALQIQLLAARLGFFYSINIIYEEGTHHNGWNRQTLYCINCSPIGAEHKSYRIFDDYVAVPIRSKQILDGQFSVFKSNIICSTEVDIVPNSHMDG